MIVVAVLFSELYTGSVANVSASRTAGLHSHHHHIISPVSRPATASYPDLSPSPSPPASFFMVDDKYVGLALAVSGTVAIGSSFIITKKVRDILLSSDVRLHLPSRRASMKQEREGTVILKHPMTTLT
jgi:hypothetical protein